MSDDGDRVCIDSHFMALEQQNNQPRPIPGKEDVSLTEAEPLRSFFLLFEATLVFLHTEKNR